MPITYKGIDFETVAQVYEFMRLERQETLAATGTGGEQFRAGKLSVVQSIEPQPVPQPSPKKWTPLRHNWWNPPLMQIVGTDEFTPKTLDELFAQVTAAKHVASKHNLIRRIHVPGEGSLFEILGDKTPANKQIRKLGPTEFKVLVVMRHLLRFGSINEVTTAQVADFMGVAVTEIQTVISAGLQMNKGLVEHNKSWKLTYEGWESWITLGNER